MVNRVVLGQRGTDEYGMWVSKPGIDVFSAWHDDHFLMRTDKKYAQVIQSGVIDLNGGFGYPTIYVPNLGFKPIIEYQVNGWNAVVGRWWGYTAFQFFPAQDGNVSPGGGLQGDYYNLWGPVAEYPDKYIIYRIWNLNDE